MKTFNVQYPIVEIVWEDIYSPDKGWMRPDEPIAPMHIKTVGYLVSETPEYVVYASDASDDNTLNGVTQIPRYNVKSIKVVRKVRKPRVKQEEKTDISLS